MASLKCMGCIPYRIGGILLAVIQIMLGITMGVLGPTVYVINVYHYNSSYSYYDSEDYASWLVGAGGALLVIAGIILLPGISCKSICLIRCYIALTVTVEIAYTVCAILLLIDTYGSVQAWILVLVVCWITFSVGFISKCGRAMIAAPMQTAQGITMTVVTQAPQVAAPPVIQNNFINQSSYSPTSYNQNQPPPPQQNQPFNNPNQQHPYPYNPDQSNQSANYPQNGSVPPQQYNPSMQTHPNAPGNNAYVNPSYNPAMNPQVNKP